MKQEFNWKLGEVVSLSRKTKTIKKSGMTSYGYIHSSRYVCIREATDREAGILVKVMGRYSTQHLTIKNFSFPDSYSKIFCNFAR